MPRAASPRKPPPPPVVEIEDDLDEDVQEQAHEPDEIEELIAHLSGDRQVVASVYRDRGEGEQWLDSMPIRPGTGLDEVLKALAKRWGHGRYRLQLREQNRRGTLGNVRLPEIAEGAAGCPAQTTSDAAPAPAPAAIDPLRELLLKQNDQLMGMMREAIARPAPPPVPGASLQDQMANLAAMFRFARGLSKAAGEPELPGWMETLGKVAAPALAAIADGIRKPPPPAAPPKPVPNEAAPLPAPAPPPAAPATAAAAEPADHADQAEERTPTDLAVAAVLKAAAAEAQPDPERYAAIVWNIAQRELTQIAGLLPDGGLAAAVAEQVPGLKAKMDFLRALETALRAKVAAGTKE